MTRRAAEGSPSAGNRLGRRTAARAMDDDSDSSRDCRAWAAGVCGDDQPGRGVLCCLRVFARREKTGLASGAVKGVGGA